MSGLPWTKFQDFYLRLGFLKALVTVLDAQRRSAMNEGLVRRLEKPLFDAAPAYPQLWSRVQPFVVWYPRKTPSGRVIAHPEVAEALLVFNEEESTLYGITHDTAYKILDWGRDVGFLGRGNQITERAIVLRHLLDQAKADAFFSGDVLAWNPFRLTLREKLFFLFHLDEIDEVTVEIAQMLGESAPGTVLESNDAAKITCRALIRVLESAEHSLSPRDIPSYRTALELAATIAEELNLQNLVTKGSWTQRPRAPKPVKPAARRTVSSTRTGAASRHTTKNADHQTIPRFEQLVDLGILSKPRDVNAAVDSSPFESRRRWRYVTTDICRRWTSARTALETQLVPFRWMGFAATAVSAFHGASVQEIAVASVDVVARYLWDAYAKVHRPLGHTPLDSVALFAMIAAASDGIVIEMADFHRLLLAIKQRGLIADCVSFASGNNLDKMFIQLKPDFPRRIAVLRDSLEDWRHR